MNEGSSNTEAGDAVQNTDRRLLRVEDTATPHLETQRRAVTEKDRIFKAKPWQYGVGPEETRKYRIVLLRMQRLARTLAKFDRTGSCQQIFPSVDTIRNHLLQGELNYPESQRFTWSRRTVFVYLSRLLEYNIATRGTLSHYHGTRRRALNAQSFLNESCTPTSSESCAPTHRESCTGSKSLGSKKVHAADERGVSSSRDCELLVSNTLRSSNKQDQKKGGVASSSRNCSHTSRQDQQKERFRARIAAKIKQTHEGMKHWPWPEERRLEIEEAFRAMGYIVDVNDPAFPDLFLMAGREVFEEVEEGGKYVSPGNLCSKVIDRCLRNQKEDPDDVFYWPFDFRL